MANLSGTLCPSVTLHNNSVWLEFHSIGTEMLLTQEGCCMFPFCSYSLTGLSPHMLYFLVMDFQPVDKGCVRPSQKYAMISHYTHPFSPSKGSTWMQAPVLFDTVKLTSDSRGDKSLVILQPNQWYIPQLHVVPFHPRMVQMIDLDDPGALMFTFPQTEFCAVSCYQNLQLINLQFKHNLLASQVCHDGMHTGRHVLLPPEGTSEPSFSPAADSNHTKGNKWAKKHCCPPTATRQGQEAPSVLKKMMVHSELSSRDDSSIAMETPLGPVDVSHDLAVGHAEGMRLVSITSTDQEGTGAPVNVTKVGSEVLLNSIVLLEKALLLDLRSLKQRQVIHPALQQVGLKLNRVDSEEAIYLQYLGVTLPLSPFPQSSAVGQDVLQNSIVQLEKALLLDLRSLKHRQVVHPALQQVGLKLNCMDSEEAIDLQYLGVTLPLSPFPQSSADASSQRPGASQLLHIPVNSLAGASKVMLLPVDKVTQKDSLYCRRDSQLYQVFLVQNAAAGSSQKGIVHVQSNGQRVSLVPLSAHQAKLKPAFGSALQSTSSPLPGTQNDLPKRLGPWPETSPLGFRSVSSDGQKGNTDKAPTDKDKGPRPTTGQQVHLGSGDSAADPKPPCRFVKQHVRQARSSLSVSLKPASVDRVDPEILSQGQCRNKKRASLLASYKQVNKPQQNKKTSKKVLQKGNKDEIGPGSQCGRDRQALKKKALKKQSQVKAPRQKEVENEALDNQPQIKEEEVEVPMHLEEEPIRLLQIVPECNWVPHRKQILRALIRSVKLNQIPPLFNLRIRPDNTVYNLRLLSTRQEKKQNHLTITYKLSITCSAREKKQGHLTAVRLSPRVSSRKLFKINGENFSNATVMLGQIGALHRVNQLAAVRMRNWILPPAEAGEELRSAISKTSEDQSTSGAPAQTPDVSAVNSAVLGGPLAHVPSPQGASSVSQLQHTLISSVAGAPSIVLLPVDKAIQKEALYYQWNNQLYQVFLPQDFSTNNDQNRTQLHVQPVTLVSLSMTQQDGST